MSARAFIEKLRPRVTRVDRAEAECFWRTSPQATPFMRPAILRTLCASVDWWLASVNDRPVCLWPVCHRADGRIEAPDFSYYVGPIWAPETDAGSMRSRVLLRTAVIRALSTTLRQAYGGFAVELPPGEHDVRPFLWWAEDAKVKHALQTRPQYTALIDLGAIPDDDTVLANFAKSRRYAVRRRLREGGFGSVRWAFDDVDRLYRLMAERQGVPELHASRVDELRALVRLVEQGFGFVEALGAESTQSVSALKLILLAGGIACEVISLADPLHRDEDLLALLAFRAIRAARDAGARIYDCNGANSLVRGFDVHSYGAAPALYFAIECWPGSMS